MNKAISAFLWALAACLISMGTLLLPQYTITPQFNTVGVTRYDECLLGTKTWKCVADHQTLPQGDVGAIAWQELPAVSFFHNAEVRHEPRPLWSPYIGSGYPIGIDGIQRKITPSSFLLTHFPSDKARDIFIFARFVFWVWGVLYALSLLEVGGLFLFFAGIAACQAPYVARYVDIIFLDTDMLGPWIFALFLRLRKFPASRNITYLGFAFLGLMVGIQSFVQAQIVFGLVLGFFALFSFFTLRRESIYALFAFSLPYLATSLPNALEFGSFFSSVISTRKFSGCIANASLPYQDIFRLSVEGLRFLYDADLRTLFSILGLPLLVWLSLKRKFVQSFCYFFAFLVIWLLAGSPNFLCRFEGINAIGFTRYLIPYTQALFLILTLFAIYEISQGGNKWKTIGVKVLLFCVVILPFISRHSISQLHLAGVYPRSVDLLPDPVPRTNIYSSVQNLSKTQDRRHYAADWRLAPNTSEQYDILDLRIVYGVYPVRLYTLNDELFKDWLSTPETGHPDRFLASDLSTRYIPPGMEKLLALHRVSVVSYSKKEDWLSHTKFYNQNHCEKIGEDEQATAVLCKEIGGVGFFPKKLMKVQNIQEAVALAKELPLEQIINSAIIETSTFDSTPEAQGEVARVERHPNTLFYDLDVTQAGFFVVSDSYFKGWSAKIDGVSTAIYPANIAFKAVVVPKGKVRLELEFSL